MTNVIEFPGEKARTPGPGAKSTSKQDYGTPWEFILAVAQRFGPLRHDLAASDHNAKVPGKGNYYTEADDSLGIAWAQHHPVGNLWLNPPFSDIAPWAAKAAAESRLRLGWILMLVPASIGSNWYHSHVLRRAVSIGLSPRMTFEGTKPNKKTGKVDPYPKDLMLCAFGFGLHGHDTWRWKP